MRTIIFLFLYLISAQLSAFNDSLRCSTPDSAFLLWNNEQTARDSFFITSTGHPHTKLIVFSIPGYDVDSFQMSKVQVDGLGEMEIIVSYTSFEGVVNYINDHVKEQHITRIFNPDSHSEIFKAISRLHEIYMHHGSEYGGEETRYFCDWSYSLRIDEAGRVYVTQVTVREDCKEADKKNGVYVFIDGEYKWHEH